jgi:hypothetical protein
MMMKELIGIGIILFAILLQICSAGMEWLTLGIGLVGLVMTVAFSMKSE